MIVTSSRVGCKDPKQFPSARKTRPGPERMRPRGYRHFTMAPDAKVVRDYGELSVMPSLRRGGKHLLLDSSFAYGQIRGPVGYAGTACFCRMFLLLLCRVC